MNKLKILLLLLILTSCKVQKGLTKNKTDTNRKIVETSTTITKRPKDSVVFVPNYVFKDTTIVKKGKSTTLILDYDKNGNVVKANCTAEELNEIKNSIIEIQESIQSKEKEKTKVTDFSSSIILYIFIGLALLLFVNKLLTKFL